jgi:hypothetical protein
MGQISFAHQTTGLTEDVDTFYELCIVDSHSSHRLQEICDTKTLSHNDKHNLRRRAQRLLLQIGSEQNQVAVCHEEEF